MLVQKLSKIYLLVPQSPQLQWPSFLLHLTRLATQPHTHFPLRITITLASPTFSLLFNLLWFPPKHLFPWLFSYFHSSWACFFFSFVSMQRGPYCQALQFIMNLYFHVFQFSYFWTLFFPVLCYNRTAERIEFFNLFLPLGFLNCLSYLRLLL